jgi:predicted nucleotidyltransferase
MSNKLIQIRKKITPIFKQYGVILADVFGSVARGEAKPSSDLDLVVTLRKPIGIFKLNEMNDKLETSLHTRVDMLTHNSINRRLKPYITSSLVRIYEEKQ